MITKTLILSKNKKKAEEKYYTPSFDYASLYPSTSRVYYFSFSGQARRYKLKKIIEKIEEFDK